MSHSAEQAYLNTRVSVMSSRLFKPELTAQLAQMSFDALAEQFGLTSLLDEQHSARARSRVIEQSLLQTLLAEVRTLIQPMNPVERSLILTWGRKYALYNLKTLIRGKLYQLDPAEIREQLFDLPESIQLPEQEIIRAENVLELLRLLEAGPHRQIARQAREVYEQQREPFALEAAIDQRHYAGILRGVMECETHHRDWLRRLIGAELDRTALLWLLRFRFSYQLSPSETYYRLVPSMRLLTRDRILRLVNLDSLPQVLEALPEPLNERLAGCSTIAEVQQRLTARTIAEARHVLTHSHSAVTRALAYLMLREVDLLHLFAVVQGRLLAFPDRIIRIALDLAEPTCIWNEQKAA